MSKIKDVVIFLPGILGSVLVDGAGKKIWSTSIGAVWQALKTGGGSLKSLELEDSGDPGEVRATELIDGITVVPLLHKTAGYQDLERSMIKDLGLTRGKNFFSFPYDWRLDNAVHAKRLEQQAAVWLHDWKKESNADDAKLVLIGHSMGGLISRYYLEVMGGWANTRSLITLGTPHRGSLNSVDNLVNGKKTKIGPLGFDINPVLRSLPSVYQLLPTYSCIQEPSGGFINVADAANKNLLPHVDKVRARAAHDFHREIYDAQLVNAQNEDYMRNGYNMIPLVSGEHPTLQSVDCTSETPRFLRSLKGNDEHGDGTVPRIAATPLELIGKQRELYLAQTHTNLQNDKLLEKNFWGLLTRPDYQLDDFRSTFRDGSKFRLSIDMKDYFVDGEPLTVKAKPSEGNPQIGVTLKHNESGKVFTEKLDIDRDTGWYVGEFGVEDGLWEVDVFAEDAQTVSDVTVVSSTAS